MHPSGSRSHFEIFYGHVLRGRFEYDIQCRTPAEAKRLAGNLRYAKRNYDRPWYKNIQVSHKTRNKGGIFQVDWIRLTWIPQNGDQA